MLPPSTPDTPLDEAASSDGGPIETETAKLHAKTVAMNEALMLSVVRQHEMTEAADNLNTQLRLEIAERIRVEKALRASEERFRTLFASAPIAVVVCDKNAVVQQFNNPAADLWGRIPVCGIERHCGSKRLWRPDGTCLPHDLSPMMDVLRTGVAATNVELIIERPDGSRVPVLANFAALKDLKGEILGAITSFIDIAARKAYEDEIRKLNANLEIRVETRTAELVKEIAKHKQTEIELVKAFHIADEANNVKSAFLARMSHELRTPMNGIIGITYLLNQTAMSPKQSDYVSKVEYSAQNLMRIINDILDFSKIESGKMGLEHVEFDLEVLLSRLLESMSVQAQGKSLESRIILATNTPRMLIGDSLRLEQVLANLVSNAAKFTKQGKIQVEVSTAEMGTTDVQLEFKVRDTGIGIDAEQLSKIFEPFYQADMSTRRPFGGTGLGLVISKRLVELLGGELTVQSDLGMGSTFSFTARFQLDPEPMIASGARRGLNFRRLALLVDSDAESCAQLTALLTELSFDVVLASSHVGAVRELSRLNDSGLQRFDIILMECSHPHFISMGDANRIRGECRNLFLPPFLLVTSEETGESPIDLADNGFDGSVDKPVTRQSLSTAIQRSMAKKPRIEAEVQKSTTPGAVDPDTH